MEEVGAILIGFLHFFTQVMLFYIYYFELCLFMETGLTQENHAAGFTLAHTQIPKIRNFDIFFPELSE